MPELTDRERDLLGFERDWWRYGVAKESAVRDRFGLSASTYYRTLGALIDRPEALAHDPLLVRRLRRQRRVRQQARASRRADRVTDPITDPNRLLR